MATKTGGGFKQQCPSCEAMVPIKDASLVGRKIDCPKCKYRFVVEPPEEAEDDSEDLPAKKGASKDAVTAKKPAPAKANSKAAPAKKMKRRDEGDEEEDEAPAKKPSGKKAAATDSKSLLLWLGVAGLAVVLLAVAAVLLIFLTKKPAPKKQPPPAPVAQAPALPPPPPATPANKPQPLIPDITNLLPNDAQLVINLPLANLAMSPIGKGAFETQGAFDPRMIRDKLGFSEKDLQRVLVAGNYDHDWLFLVVRLKPNTLNFQNVANALGLIEVKEGSHTLYQTPYSWMSGTSSLLSYGQTARTHRPGPRPLAALRVDPQTMVMGDLSPMRSFLRDFKDGHVTMLTDLDRLKREKAAEEERKKKAAEAAAPQIRRRGVGGRRRGGGEEGGGEGGGEEGEGGQPAADAAKPEDQISGHYLTIPFQLKAMMDLQEIKQPLLFSMADDIQHDRTGAALQVLERLRLRPLMTVLGFCIQQTPDGYTLFVGMELPTEKFAVAYRGEVRREVEMPLRYLAALLGLRPIVFEDPPPEVRASVVAAPPGRRRNQGTRGRDEDVEISPEQQAAADARATALAAAAERRKKEEADAQAALLELQKRLAQSAKPGEELVERGSVKVKVENKGGMVLLEIATDLTQQATMDMPKLFGPMWILAKGQMERAIEKPRIHDLAKGAEAYLAKNKAFPRGAFDRQTSPARGNRPYPPDQRVSWMADLLPYLGHSDVANLIDPQKSWQDPANFNASITTIPEFLDSQNPNAPARVSYPELHVPLYLGAELARAATHYVGIAGIGADAAQLKLEGSPPDVIKRLGIFGYDRTTRLEDVTDGVANTIMIAEAAPPYYGPWIAGGGSTIRGVPETHSIEPFVATTFNGKPGTTVVMADGSVRFIAATISDEVFKALCTIKGKEWIDLEKETAKIVPAKIENPVLQAEVPQQGRGGRGRRLSRDDDSRGEAPAGDWQEFVSQEGRFSVLMPGHPEEQTAKVPSPDGETAHSFIHDTAKQARYGVLYFDLAAAPPPDQIESGFADIRRKAMAMLPGARLADEQRITVEGHPGQEFTLELPNQQSFRARMFIDGKRVYELLVGGPPQSFNPEDEKKFFDSFKLLK